MRSVTQLVVRIINLVNDWKYRVLTERIQESGIQLLRAPTSSDF